MNMDLYADMKGAGNETQRTSHNTSTNSYLPGSGVINVNNLPLPSDLSETETTIFQSAVFIEDGVRYRSIHHRIDPKALKLYRVYYSKFVRWCLGLAIFVNLILAFFEYPTSFTLSSDSRFRDSTWRMPEPHCGITESVEILCLLVFLVDCCCKFYLLGWKRFLRKPWQVLYLLMILLSFIDVTTSIAFCIFREEAHPAKIPYSLRLRRFCRPLFFLISSTIMKKFVKAVVLTLPQIFYVLVLLVLHLYVFTMIGLLAFPRPVVANGTNSSSEIDVNGSIPFLPLANASNLRYSHYAELEGNTYFDSVTNAFISLLVLLTTANHPDVMIPIYQYNRFSSLYFILFLGIGAFLILNLLIAATYNQFKGFFQKSMQSSFNRRCVAFRAAFTLLARQTQEMSQKRGHRLSYIQEVASKDLIRRVLQKARIPKKQLPQMYSKLEGGTSSSQYLTWQQFREVFDLVSTPPATRHPPRLPFYGRWRWLQYVQYAIRHKYFYYITHAFSFVNVVLMTVELQISYDKSLTQTNSRLAYYNLFFVGYYILEQALKLLGLGFRGYFRSIGNIYEGVITVVLVMMEILVLTFSSETVAGHYNISSVFHYDTAIRVMNILIVLRLLRIMAHVKSLRVLISIIIDLFKNLSGFMGLMAIAYYIFALLGMALFYDVDGPSKVPTDDGRSWSEECGTFDNLNYYANNFHDFASSLVTLWDVMVVNNWFVFLDKFSRDSMLGGWSQIYFIVWWLIAAIIGMNLFVSLVLDTFLIKWEAFYNRQSLDEDNNILDAEVDMFSESNNWEGTSIATENFRSDIHKLLSAKLKEPEESYLKHELHKHKDIKLVHVNLS